MQNSLKKISNIPTQKDDFPGEKKNLNVAFVTFVSIIVAIGGLMFGYDTAVISGAIGFLDDRYNLSPSMSGWVVSSILVGAVIGTALGGLLSDRFGRKKTLILSGILFGIGTIGTAIPNSVSVLVIARIIGGIGVGMSVFLSPLYIAEIAPAHLRGRLGSMSQLAISIGQSSVFLINYYVAQSGSYEWNVAVGWRWMFAIGAIPAIAYVILMLFVTDTPRWLASKGRKAEALVVLNKVNLDMNVAQRELKEIEASLASGSGGTIGNMFKGTNKKPLFIGVVIAFLTQWAGINAIMYYAPEIFKQSGASLGSAFLNTVFMGIVVVLFTLLGLWLMDKAGRRKLFLIGSLGMALALFMIGLAFNLDINNGVWLLVYMLFYLAVFMTTVGPGMWVLLSEIFPTRIRGQAMALSTISLWIGDYLISHSFPVLLREFGGDITFWFFAVGSIVMFFFTYKFIPETRNKTLEEIEQMFNFKQ
ncbi:sugar porter family MFS transporter [Peribacillus muralis]|uniref:sugar porter family MFS transporter n=1 Tax=Peribacillus muralis TaxID=264697 RepID=UPI001F4EDB5D|nr:sugar porter family MFS transporter [Peribacillus muralis]MCK1995355.1 sugar porter family MFS transporter [Peribacillus muralis]MCK2015886.1 sugar porter family MFS transporter [Peribacillus muralis]